ncbi:RNA polymerase sigma factor [Lacunimicrobium album]
MALTSIDRDLLQRCLSHDRHGWKDFVDRFIGLFIHVVHHTAQSRSVDLHAEDVDDYCSEILMALLKDDAAVLRKFRGESSLATYLTVISRRVVVHQMVSRRQAAAMGHISLNSNSIPEEITGFHADDLEKLEDREQIQQLVATLPPQEGNILRLFYLEGKSYQQISKILGVPVNSIGPTLTKARAHLKQNAPAV